MGWRNESCMRKGVLKWNVGLFKVFFAAFCFIFIPATVFASEGKLNSGDTAWMIVATAFVMFMTPAGLALFYGGMSRSKNILNTVAMSFVAYCVVSIVWVLYGYSLSFAPDVGGVIGNLKYIVLNSISTNSINSSVPTYIFAAFQMTFAAITVALISGSVIERLRFSSWIIFSILWVSFVYIPIAHWVWGGGFLSKMGILDFAGGTVVHINAGVAGLVFALILGKRMGFKKIVMPPSSIVLTTLGASMLWFGWFGFNAGSALASNGSAALAFINTNTAASFAALSWMCTEWAKNGHPTVLGAASGAVAGLVAITPSAGYVNIVSSMIIGLVSGVLGFYGASYLKFKLNYDDSLDAFGVHGINGIWGAIATGIFADPSICGSSGLIYGNIHQFLVQILGVVMVLAYTSFMTFVVIKLTAFITKGLRVTDEDELKGLDIAVHTEKGFEL